MANSSTTRVESPGRSDNPRHGAGLLIVNADDWGRDQWTTGKILDCTQEGAVSAVSAMVFMEDSERAAAIAQERGIDAGLHLNLTTPLSASGCSALLVEHHAKLVRYLLAHKLRRLVHHPGLSQSFEYVVAAQFDEFCRLYGAAPDRVDGHHHMHLCANVLVQRLVPEGTLVRRNFSFEPGEKSRSNRLYRRLVDTMLSRRHRLADFLFGLAPLSPSARLQRIFSLAREFVVELETHPVNNDEYRYLTGGNLFREARDVRIGQPSSLSRRAGCGKTADEASSEDHRWLPIR